MLMFIQWYKVKYLAYGETIETEISIPSKWVETPKKGEIEAWINTELEDSTREAEDYKILEVKRIQTPEEMQIPWMEEYYKLEQKQIENEQWDKLGKNCSNILNRLAIEDWF
jgi:hypothetical protein